MLGERERAAAISSRPTWAMNTTAGSAARAGDAVAADQAMTRAALAEPTAKHRALRHQERATADGRAGVVMRLLVPRSALRRRLIPRAWHCATPMVLQLERPPAPARSRTGLNTKGSVV